MNKSAEKILYRKAVLIFEELGFLMPNSDGGESRLDDCSTATVSFNGPFSGCLLVSVSQGILPVLASNMLGEQGAKVQSLQQDALCEIGNIICGNVLPAIYGFKPVFHLDAPEVTDASVVARLESAFEAVAKVHVGFDSGHAEVMLFADANASEIS